MLSRIRSRCVGRGGVVVQCLLASAAVALGACSSESSTAETPEAKGDGIARAFAQAILDEDYQAASACMTPTMQAQVSGRRLQAMMEEAASAITPTGFSLEHGMIGADELRENAIDFPWDVPFPVDVTNENFRS